MTEAERTWPQVLAELDALREEIRNLRTQVARLTNERDDARAWSRPF